MSSKIIALASSTARRVPSIAWALQHALPSQNVHAQASAHAQSAAQPADAASSTSGSEPGSLHVDAFAYRLPQGSRVPSFTEYLRAFYTSPAFTPERMLLSTIYSHGSAAHVQSLQFTDGDRVTAFEVGGRGLAHSHTHTHAAREDLGVALGLTQDWSCEHACAVFHEPRQPFRAISAHAMFHDPRACVCVCVFGSVTWNGPPMHDVRMPEVVVWAHTMYSHALLRAAVDKATAR